MHRKDYEQLGESIYYDTLSNGLKLFVIPKPGFHKVFMSLGVNYGSIDNTFVPADSDKKISLPAGVAHFLEHKMFDKKDYDADDLFNRSGASSNAFTSFTETNYLVEMTSQINDNLNFLLDFVQTPYFTAPKVKKEKGIIEQEIKMYQDDPDSRLYFDTVRNMYPDFPLNQDVAGSVESIHQITLDDLKLAYNNFYQPNNMKLVVTGDVDPNQIEDLVINNQAKKHFNQSMIGNVWFDQTGLQKINHFYKSNLDLAQPKVAIGIKGQGNLGKGVENLKNELILNMLLNILLSSHSKLNADLYREGIIDDSFGFEMENERNFYFAFIASDTDHPNEFVDRIQSSLLSADQHLFEQNNELQLLKREMIGRKIMETDSLEQLTLNVGDDWDQYVNLYDEIGILKTIQIDDLIQMAQRFFKLENMTVNIIK